MVNVADNTCQALGAAALKLLEAITVCRVSSSYGSRLARPADAVSVSSAPRRVREQRHWARRWWKKEAARNKRNTRALSPLLPHVLIIQAAWARHLQSKAAQKSDVSEAAADKMSMRKAGEARWALYPEAMKAKWVSRRGRGRWAAVSAVMSVTSTAVWALVSAARAATSAVVLAVTAAEEEIPAGEEVMASKAAQVGPGSSRVYDSRMCCRLKSHFRYSEDDPCTRRMGCEVSPSPPDIATLTTESRRDLFGVGGGERRVQLSRTHGAHGQVRKGGQGRRQGQGRPQET
jgi:hypothetical protein